MEQNTTCRESSGFPKFSLGTLFLKLTVFQKQGVHSSNGHSLIENHLHSMAQYALGWQNLFGSTSKYLNKNCLRQIFNFVIVGALISFFFRSCCVNCKICTVFTPDKNLFRSEAGRRRLWSLVMVDKIWWEKNQRAHLYHGNDDNFFRKIHEISLVRPGPCICNCH